MNGTFCDTVEELNLVVNIFDTLIGNSPNGQLRRDQVDPLTTRLRRVAEQLCTLQDMEAHRPSDAPHRKLPLDNSTGVSHHENNTRLDSCHALGSRNAAASASASQEHKSFFKVTKASSVRAKAVPRDEPSSSSLHISKEVARVITSTMYNMLEGATNLLRASSASIYIRQGDEMVSIANVSQRLNFPPQLVRHRCVGSKDADVLASGIALNLRINDVSQAPSSVLVFPIHGKLPNQQQRGVATPIATIHMENKAQGTMPFDAHDEALLYLISCLVGELMSRVPQMDWIRNFYDPITQHIVAPFNASKQVTLPPLPNRKEGVVSKVQTGSARHGAGTLSGVLPQHGGSKRDEGSPGAVDPKLLERVEEYLPEVMIKRESVPQQQARPPAYGLTQMPTLREVRCFVDNIQECWKKNVTSNVELVEKDRTSQMETRQLRRELADTRAKLAAATEQLRLYQLNIGDYKHEYHALRGELDMYIKSHDTLRT